MSRVGESLMNFGNGFHNVGVEYQKDHAVKVWYLTFGVYSMVPVLLDHILSHVLLFKLIRSCKYLAALLVMHCNVVIRILCSLLCCMGSQCSSLVPKMNPSTYFCLGQVWHNYFVFVNRVGNQLMVLCLIDFTYSSFKYVNHPFQLYIPTVIYNFDMFLITSILAGSMQGHIEVPGGECHAMHLGATFSHFTKRGRECPLWHLCSKQRYPLKCTYQVHVQTFLPKRA